MSPISVLECLRKCRYMSDKNKSESYQHYQTMLRLINDGYYVGDIRYYNKEHIDNSIIKLLIGSGSYDSPSRCYAILPSLIGICLAVPDGFYEN